MFFLNVLVLLASPIYGSEEDLVCDKTFGGSYADVADCIKQTSDGGYIAAGYNWSEAVDMADAWLLHVDKRENWFL